MEDLLAMYNLHRQSGTPESEVEGDSLQGELLLLQVYLWRSVIAIRVYSGQLEGQGWASYEVFWERGDVCAMLP